MTAFVLVSDTFTGGWVWEETAARLRAAGAEAYPVTLTGMGDRRAEAGPGTGLETHIEDLVDVLDGITATEVVLVGHGYGLYPLFGAADRRAGRVARIVSVDTGPPEDGGTAVRAVPDPEVREALAARPDAWVPPPAPGTWSRWGSVEGIPAEALARLEHEAAPQPAGTLTEPLRLTGAVSALSLTGILCAANGQSIAMVEMAVASGPPQFRVLTEDRFRFFELATGHWPMLSAPGELAEVLLRAAAGEGHRVTAPEHAHEQPSHLLPFLIDVPERPRDRVGRVDLHLPDADGPRPAVVFVHGGPIEPDRTPTPRDMPFFLGYGRYAAGMGVVGVTVDHRLHGLADYARAAADIAEAVELVRADPRVDGDRIALLVLLHRRAPGGGLARGAPAVAALRRGELSRPGAAARLGIGGGPLPPRRHRGHGGRAAGRPDPRRPGAPGLHGDRRGVPDGREGTRGRRRGRGRAARPPQLRTRRSHRRVPGGRGTDDARGPRPA
ncbi:hypothetical protein STANM337S_06069 [Streptomyces tanashiensis]